MCRKLTGCPSTSSDNGYQRLSGCRPACLCPSQRRKVPYAISRKKERKIFFMDLIKFQPLSHRVCHYLSLAQLKLGV